MARVIQSHLLPEWAIARPEARPGNDPGSQRHFFLRRVRVMADWVAFALCRAKETDSPELFVAPVSVAGFSPEAGPAAVQVFDSARFRLVCFGRSPAAVVVVVVAVAAVAAVAVVAAAAD